ncbi:hypothetical protein O6H91_06G048500 [Diphasiastrum complanatum]|uniref:Uncharacterized protein n=1 Tax=Diphasiastrum complanatum TaxID=34168 RepID=A0ACC2DE86_DIPCM|nr:hypothetical protein O6H91_06G048500 [Diphasiastrum complanatum]
MMDKQRNPAAAVQYQAQNAGPSGWTSGLCGCCSDCFSCCLTCWLPCVAFGQIAQKVDDDQSSCFVNGLIYAAAYIVGLPCCYSCLYRRKMRAKYQLGEEPCNDFCTHCFCEPCALCQEYRELQNRGLDPTLSTQQIMMAPTPTTMH